MREHLVALVPGLRFGELELAVGDPVPIESGRDYDALLRRGAIGRSHGAPSAPPLRAPEHLVDLSAAGLDFEALAERAAEAGIEPPAYLVDLRSCSWSGLLELAREHGIVSDQPLELEVDEESLRTAAAALGFVLVPAGPAAEPETAPETPALPEIPETLPTTRAELDALCKALGLEVVGTGSKGYTKESDFVGAIEAERARRAAAAAGE